MVTAGWTTARGRAQDGQKRYTSEVIAEALLMLGARPETAPG